MQTDAPSYTSAQRSRVRRTTGGPQPGSRSNSRRLPGSPWWLSVLVLYALSRLWSTGLLGAWFTLAKSHGWRLGNVAKSDDFWSYLTSWDARFYSHIAEHGYPSRLPLDASGHVIGGEWAFLPVFPAIGRALAGVTGIPITVSLVIVATLSGGAAAMALYRLVADRVGHRAAMWAVVLFCFGPISFLLEVGYAEGLFVFLLFVCLGALGRRQYLGMIPFGLVAAFTRPGILAFSVALGVHVATRLVRDRAGFRVRERVTAVTAGVLITAAGLGWAPIAAAATGHPSAYLDTEMAWWVSSIGHVRFVPFTPGIKMSVVALGPAGPLVLLVVAAGFLWWISRRSLRILGADLLTFGAGYVLYLSAVFLPQQSLLRLVLLPFAPFAGDPAITQRPWLRRGMLVACLVAQPVAVVLLWSVWFP